MTLTSHGPLIAGAMILACIVFICVMDYTSTNNSIARYRSERFEWIVTNEERNKRVYDGDMNGVFSLEKITTHETINGVCCGDCFEIICFHNFKVVETIFKAERVPILEGAVCPMKPSDYLARRYKNGEVVIVVHDVDPGMVDTLRDHSF